MSDFDTSTLIGKPLGEAKQILKDTGLMIRILKRNGKAFPPTSNIKENRLNVNLEDNIIIEIFGVY
jgi:hypothetical protein